jgi:hypothetical protein
MSGECTADLRGVSFPRARFRTDLPILSLPADAGGEVGLGGKPPEPVGGRSGFDADTLGGSAAEYVAQSDGTRELEPDDTRRTAAD